MKKFFTYLLIVIGVAIFACLALAVFLVLAPGTEVFGIKYVSAVVGEYQTTIRKTFVSQDIYIYADDVPINISFAKSGTVGIEYVQHYQGFTRAKDVPEVTFKNKDGQEYDDNRDTDCVCIYVNQYKKFIWSNDIKDFYLNLNLPYEYKSNATIHVETDNSLITFSGTTKTVKSLTVKTDKKVEFENNITIQNLNLECKERIELGSNVSIAPLTASATSSLSVKIPNESLTVVNPVKNGDIKFETASGNLNFNTCHNLTVTSGSGNIEQPTSKYISGNLNFETTSGNVSIDNVKGTDNSISSTSGNINIGFCAGDLKIATNRAAVTLGTIVNATINTTTGDITITYVNGNIIAEASRSGDILCGRVVGNAEFETLIGDITVGGAVGGNLKMTTKSGNMQMVSATNLEMQSEEGSLSGYNGANIVVSGVANVQTDKGSITISKISGTSSTTDSPDNTIRSNNGEITVGQIVGTSKITSYNAPITINSTGFVTINTSYSPVTIAQATSGATISNISGNISVGTMDSQTITTGNVNIKSSEGTINVYNTTGDVYLYSNQAITLVNKSSSKIYINTTVAGDYTGSSTGRGQVTATRLQGDVRVCSQHDVVLTFTQVTDDVRVSTTGASSKVIIDVECISESSINYLIQSSKNVESDLYIGGTKTSAIKFDKTNGADYKSIKVYTTYAKVTLKLA